MNALRQASYAIVFAGCWTAPAHAAEPEVRTLLQPASGSNARGQITFTQTSKGVRIVGQVQGLTPGPHGFHLHEHGDCSAPDASSAGEHFNPHRQKHGSLDSAQRHAGDFGNILADASGMAKIDLTATGISLMKDRPDSIIGRAIVVHADPDDGKSDPAGQAGARVACGVLKGWTANDLAGTATDQGRR